MCPPPIRYASWTIERNRGDARLIEPARAALCEQILVSAPIPKRDFEPVSASFAFAGPHGAERAIEIGAKTYGSLQIPPRQQVRSASRAKARHRRNANIRGPRY